MVLTDIAQAIIGAVQLVVGTAVNIVSTLLNMATGSQESALVFGVLFMLVAGGLVWFAYGQTNVDRPSSMANALFGNVTTSSHDINPYYNYTGMRAYVLNTGMVFVGLPEGTSVLSLTKEHMTYEQMLEWSPQNTDCQALAAIAAGTSDHIWQGRLIVSRDWLDVLCTDCYQVQCSWAPVTDNAALTNTTNVTALQDEIRLTYPTNLCGDHYALSDARLFGFVPYGSVSDCWMIRNNATKERVYYTSQPIGGTGETCMVDSPALTNLVLTTLYPGVFSEATLIGARPETTTVTVVENGTFAGVLKAWTETKYTVLDAVAGSDPISNTLKGFYGFVEGGIYALAMVVITILGCIAIIAISKVL